TYLRKAGLIQSQGRGISEITPAGIQALTDCPNRVDNSYLRQFGGFSDRQSSADEETAQQAPDSQDASLDPTDRLEQAYQELQFSLAKVLLSLSKQQPPAVCEKLVVQPMRAMG